MKNLSDTQQIPAAAVFLLFALGPIIACVYALYAIGFAMKNAGWPNAVVYPFGAAFAVINVAHNWTVCTILFREFPREGFTTTRLKRWGESEDDGRRELADLLGGFLNRHDEGHYRTTTRGAE